MTVSSSAASVLIAAKTDDKWGNLPHTCFSVCALAAFHSSLFLERHSGASHLLLSSSSASRHLSSSFILPPSFPPAPAAAPTQRFLACSASLPLLSHEDTGWLQGKLVVFPLSLLLSESPTWSHHWFLLNTRKQRSNRRGTPSRPQTWLCDSTP